MVLGLGLGLGFKLGFVFGCPTPGRKQTWHRPEGWVSAMPG